MKLITKLDKPYTKNQRNTFIATQNHNLGYDIRETETELQAWGLDDEELLEQKKQQVRYVRNNYLEQYVDPKQLFLVWESLSLDDKQMYIDYRNYLLDYTKEEEWWLENPMTFDEWLMETQPENLIIIEGEEKDYELQE